MTDKAKLEFSFDFKPVGKPREPDQPFRILVVGDFSGENTDHPNQPRLQTVDIDNFDEVMDRIAPIVTVASHQGVAARLQAFTLEDFHPDEIYDKLAPFNDLRELKKRLQNTTTFSAAAAEMMAGQSTQVEAAQPAEPPTDSAAESDDDAIERLLGRPASPQAQVSKAVSGIDSLLQRIVAPHITPNEDPQQASLVRSVEASIAALMTEVLHVPALQALEARWRALFALVSNAELDGAVEVVVWDTTRENLLAMVEHPDTDPMSSQAAKLLASRDTPASWSLVVTDLTVSTEESDLLLIAKLASVTSGFGSPVLACASPALYGCTTSINSSPDSDQWLPDSDPSQANWQQLRRSGIAEWIGLCSPRLLQRLPYGAKTDPVSPFAYEEFESGNPEDLLWGPASMGCAALLATSYCARQWNMTPGEHTDIVDLPGVTVQSSGQRDLVPCAEVTLSDRSAEEVLARGVMPLHSYKNRNAARLFRFQSIASPTRPLAGPWNS